MKLLLFIIIIILYVKKDGIFFLYDIEGHRRRRGRTGRLKIIDGILGVTATKAILPEAVGRN